MSEVKQYYKGQLISQNEVWPVDIRFASKYSLWLTFHHSLPKGRTNDNTDHIDYDHLKFDFKGQIVQTGRCRLLLNGNKNEDEFRLVPLQSIHNFEKLFFKNKEDSLESTASKLSLILSYKKKIKPEFIKFISDINYDLSTFRNIFDQIDQNIKDEPDEVQNHLRQGIIESLGQKLLSFLEDFHSQLKEITRNYSKEEHEHHGFYFRRQLWDAIQTAPIMKRTNTKPRGYIGDSIMMRMLYTNGYEGSSTFGQLMHRHALQQPAADAVRNRRFDMARFIQQSAQNKAPGNGPFKVLSIACGPALELHEIIHSSNDVAQYHFSLLDQDRHALLEAADTIEELENRTGVSFSVDYINESVRTMLVTKELQEQWGRFHFIYSMGLFDYLTTPVAVSLLRKLAKLLVPGGKMIIGNFANENPTKTFMDYWMDWPLIYRSEEDMLHMASKVNQTNEFVERDNSGIQMYLHMQKKE